MTEKPEKRLSGKPPLQLGWRLKNVKVPFQPQIIHNLWVKDHDIGDKKERESNVEET
jgi:hypothetical protein